MLARSSNPGRLGIERLFESAGMLFRCSSCLDQDVAAGCVWLRSPLGHEHARCKNTRRGQLAAVLVRTFIAS